MTPQKTIEILTLWKKLLEQMVEIEIDLEASPETMENLVAQRQNIITDIQAIDASLKEIGKQRSSGWPNLDSASKEIAENLAVSATIVRDRIVNNDAHTIDIAKEKRLAILGQLKNTGLRTSYVKSYSPSHNRPPIIVDSKL